MNRIPRKIKRSTSVPSVLSVAEYERIKQNAKLSSEDEEQNDQKILSQQRQSQLAKDKAHINLLKEIDKKRPQYIIKTEKTTLSQGNSILAAAKKAKENALDASKEMSTLLNVQKLQQFAICKETNIKGWKKTIEKKRLN